MSVLYADPVEDARARRRLRRSACVVIALLDVLVVAVGLAGTSDLRRLRTPEGTAGAFAEAALGGDCERFRDLLSAAARAELVAARPAGDGPDGVVAACTASTSAATRLVATRVAQRAPDGRSATVVVVLRPADGGGRGGTRDVALLLLLQAGRWRVAPGQAAALDGP